jgi:Protein of unknown function (DUF1236)
MIVEEFGKCPEEAIMNRVQLLTTVAASLLLAAGTAAAQDQPVKPQQAPTVQRHAPAEKIGPPLHAGVHAKSETTGQAVEQPKAGMNAKSETGGQATERAKTGMKRKSETTGQAPSLSQSGKSEQKDEATSNSKLKGGIDTAHSPRADKTSHPSATTGQGAAAGSAKLSGEQRAKITTIIRQQKVPQTHINVSVRVGARIPVRVHYYALPPAVIAVYPEWQGYDYILVGEQIVIVDPRTHLIVAILEA